MTPELIAACTGCTLLRASLFAKPLTDAMARWGIDKPLRQAAFLAQVAHESGQLAVTEENLNYSAQRLKAVWPGRFPTLDRAQAYAHNPEALANFVYGGRMGNTLPGDGFKYRGRGLIQLTGKDNYTAYLLAAGVDVLSNPDLLKEPADAAGSAGFFWSTNGCNTLADRENWDALTRKINGGLNGQAERLILIKRARKVLGC